MEILLGGVTLSLPVLVHSYRQQQRARRLGGLRSLHFPQANRLQVRVPVHVLSTPSEIEEAFAHVNTQFPVLGLDAEWKPNQTKGASPHPVAILQVATPEAVYVIQLLPHYTSSTPLPLSLVALLENPEIVKVGVGISQDVKKMRRDYHVQIRGCVDLSFLSMLQAPDVPCSLKSLTEHYTQLSFPKEKPIQLSDWSVPILSANQISYAAADAWAGLLIFEQLLLLQLKEHACDWSSWWKDTSMPQRIQEWTHPYWERKWVSPLASSTTATSGGKGSKEMKAPGEGAGEESSRRTPLYEGCQMVDPDGAHVAWCNRDKVKWYLEKEIAVLLPDSEPPVIQLKFFPSGNGSRPYASEGQQTGHQLQNCCVICGRTESYRKFYIVPRTYRSFFPHHEKFHCSHDIVLLCPTCHYQCSERFEAHKAEAIATEYQVPMNGMGEAFLVDKEAAKVASCAKQLQRNRKKMNATQIEETEQLIRDYLQVDALTPALVKKAATMPSKKKNPDYLSHAEAVVRILEKDPHGIQKFAVMWRRVFEREMRPQHLPAYWDVNHEWEEHHGTGQRKHPHY